MAKLKSLIQKMSLRASDMGVEATFGNIINNFSLNKAKTKWEVLGQLSDQYLKTGRLIREVKLRNTLAGETRTPTNVEPYEKYRTDLLELIKVLANSQP
jgi:hypothetical protein